MTEAGKRLVQYLQDGADVMLDDVVVVEEEAVANERKRIAEAVRELAESHGYSTGHGRYVWAQSVLRIVDPA